MTDPEKDLTGLLHAVSDGDENALEQLAPLVYSELRRLAHIHMKKEANHHTLQTTALVHEAFVRLIGTDVGYKDRIHFYSLASRMMRHILVDHARARRRDKRGGGADPLPIDEVIVASSKRDWDLVDLDRALDKLGEFEPRQVRALELRFFAGLTNDEIARALGVSSTTAREDMRVAQAWLRRELGKGSS